MTAIKALTGVSIKNADEGVIEAVFATFNIKDLDGDVTLPGAFEDGAEVQISSFGHASWGPSRGSSSVPQPPVGKGQIKVVGDEARLEGRFFLKTQAGRDHFELVKEMGDLQEWSYGYDTLEASPGTFKGEPVQFLKRQKVYEVSPVLKGAGIGTRTVAVKEAVRKTFADINKKQLDSALTDALREAGGARYGSADTYVWVDDVELDASWVVFCVSTNGDQEYHRVAFTRADDGAVTLAEGDEVVERTTSYTAKSLKFVAHIESVVADVEKVIARSADVMAMRREKGKGLSEDSLEILERLDDGLKRLREVMASEPPDENPAEMVLREFARFEHLRANL